MSFLGQFDTAWGLNRDLGANGPLPTPAKMIAVQLISDFLLYSDEVERGNVHRGAHVWTGGAMPTPLSPRDPIFYLHHTFVDKLWAQWEDLNPNSSSYISTSMLRYDGTYVFNGVTLPVVNPNDITNTRDLGVFYAEDGLASLSDYQVRNTYRSEEVFYYQYLIEAGDNFRVPSGRKARIESVEQIQILPGFSAEAGSSFYAGIDTDGIINTAGKRNLDIWKKERMVAFEYSPAILNTSAYDPRNENPVNLEKLTVYNPFEDTLDVELNMGKIELRKSGFMI